mmetsp:Transcript_48054/g.57947  ORF Transcript_48054/g.57947 Transcript_48054/m.57947 type:complete len:188 (+) Transcript_48054:61-624(+)
MTLRYKQLGFIFKVLLCKLLLCTPFVDSFAVNSAPFQCYSQTNKKAVFSRASHLMLNAVPGKLGISTLIAESVGTNDVDSFQNAFTDSISFFDDGTIRTTVISGVVVITILSVLKIVSQKMDAAIEKVLIDFEGTMARYFPDRWQKMSQQLEGLNESERSAKLFVIMEEFQAKEPNLMKRVNEKMPK